jgi:hypothetical protein
MCIAVGMPVGWHKVEGFIRQLLISLYLLLPNNNTNNKNNN